ncbi:putative protein enhanced disease resistance 4 [Helianthus annuus]|nr:putative protein enhanced disease resistance 4 [Helianthus annuus]
MSKSSFVNETGEFTSSIHETIKSFQLERRLQTGMDIQSRSEENSKSFHKGEQPSMRGKMKIWFVRCPKCLNVLPEPPDVTLYKCGGCGAEIQAKKRAEPISHTYTDRGDPEGGPDRDRDSEGHTQRWNRRSGPEAVNPFLGAGHGLGEGKKLMGYLMLKV